jgi:hypothetical protein
MNEAELRELGRRRERRLAVLAGYVGAAIGVLAGAWAFSVRGWQGALVMAVAFCVMAAWGLWRG